ncbi:MAG: CRTAC1 family protein, partial [Chloroflexota bacterium]|nr:CRTAC1 family protein [Chloroflexota bacterium]
PSAAQETPVSVTRAVLDRDPAMCSGAFVRHELAHVTETGTEEVRMFASNGAGLAVNDLDDDGDEDIVLANLADPNTVLWNEGGLRFRKQELSHGDSRGVAIVDVDADGQRDVIFTRHTLPPTIWINGGEGKLLESVLPGVEGKLWAMNWGDLDADGDLDMVGGAYDAGLEKDLGYSFMFTRSGGGVYFYENLGDSFGYNKLSERSEALAVALYDTDQDGASEILVGNDFDLPDQSWKRTVEGWTLARPFARTSHSTMSFDAGDIDNDGDLELFSTDMKPYYQDVRTLAKWRPLVTRMPHETFRGDPQIMENVLQVRRGEGKYRNEAYARDADATGWSWSGKFGDLDMDGYLDLYVVNGMLATDLFDYLPERELIEENQVLRNVGGRRFERKPEWGLGSTASGRGMTQADLDRDGDLDIVVNNLAKPAELFENQLCEGRGMLVELRWPNSKNTSAVGASVLLHTSTGVYRRDVGVASGYLSGEPATLHFGIPDGAQPQRFEVRWPDGKVSFISDLSPQTELVVTR